MPPRLDEIGTFLTRPLWVDESPGGRRCRLAFGIPFASVVGIACGWLAAGHLGIPLFPALAGGVVALPTLFFLLGELEVGVRILVEEVGPASFGPFVPFALDVLVGAGVGRAAGAMVVDASALTWVGLGSALGFGYAFVSSQILCGGFERGAAALLGGTASDAPARTRGYPVAETLAARGAYEAAADTYRDAIEEAPELAGAYLRLARILSRELERPEEALRWLRRCAEASPGPEEAHLAAARAILDLCRNELGNGLRAAPDVARLARRYPGGDAGRWARETLEELKGEIARAREEELSLLRGTPSPEDR